MIEQKLYEAHQRIQGDPDKAKGCGHVYELCITDMDKRWIVDLRHSPGVYEASPHEPECTISMNAEDFMKLASGEITAALLFYTGKLKVGGNQALLMKLGVLEELLK